MRVATYLRVSSQEQASAGTIDTQRQYAAAYCAAQGLQVVETFEDEATSGALPLEKRPAGARLLALVKAGGLDAVLVYRIDRFSRSVLELLRAVETLDQHRVALRSMSEPFDTSSSLGRCLLTLLGAFAELERATFRERSMLGAARVAREGRWGGGRAAYGYQIAPDGSLVIEESEAAVVRRVYALYLDGHTCGQVARLLSAEGVPTWAERRESGRETQGRWAGPTVRDMLRSPTYCGRRRYRATETEQGKRKRRIRAEEIVEGPAPAIIGEEEWVRVQARLDGARQKIPGNAKREYLLRGLIRCGACERIMGGNTCGGGYTYYRCHRDADQDPARHCRAPMVRADAIEPAVWADVQRWLRNPGAALERIAARHRDEISARVEVEAEGERLESAAAELEQQRERVIRMLRRALITEQEGDVQLREITEDLAALHARRHLVFARDARLAELGARLVTARATLGRFADFADTEDPGERRAVLEALVEGIRIGRREGEQQPRVLVRYVFERPTLTRPDGESNEFLFVSENHLPRLPRRLGPLPRPGQC